MDNIFADVIVIGAGASGLAAAISAKRKNSTLKIIVLESGEKPARKLLATGNGRCNLTNMNLSAENFSGSFNPSGAIGKITPKRLIGFFESLGLVCKAENNGLVYPLNKQSSAVRNALLLECNRLNIKIICSCTALNITKNGSLFTIKTQGKVYKSRKAVVCCGSKASPSCGGTGASVDLLHNMGIKTAAVHPSLCPIEVKDRGIKNLKGVRASATVTLFDGRRKLAEEKGELQFTENALSGICVFNLSSDIFGTQNPVIKVSFMPDYNHKQVKELLLKQKKLMLSEPVPVMLSGIINDKLSVYIAKRALNSDCSNKKAKDLTDEEIESICQNLLSCRFECIKPYDFKKAQVMSGGVAGNTVDGCSFECFKTEGLYFCGEILDINGKCGGYNLHFAFASGILAGESI